MSGSENDQFKVGDLVTRDGTDVQRVLDKNADDQILVECLVAPQGYWQDDGTQAEPWVKVGEQEWNLARRYTHTTMLIETVPVSVRVNTK
jgi:hypothetical protein